MRKLICFFCAFLCAVVLAVSGHAAAASADPEAVVGDFHQSLLAVWQTAGEVPPDQRFARLEPAVTSSFNLEHMLRGATGSYWAKATNEQKATLLEAFKRYSVANYVGRFDRYSGQTLTTTGQKTVSDDTVIVNTRIDRPSGTPVSLDYTVNKTADRWQIVDIRYERDGKAGNEVPRLHGEFRNILKTGGPDLLAEKLNGLTEKLLTP